MTPQELKNSILQLAIQGKLVEQRPEEGTAEELFAQIQEEKQRLIAEKKIKKEKPLPEITDDEKPFDIPESWMWVRVGSCGSWGSGATPSRTNLEYYGGTIPWLKTGDLNDGIITEIPEYITELALEKTSVRLNPIGSVLMAMYGATIGKLGILGIEATTNQACCACIPYEGVYNKFLFYFLMASRTVFIKMGEGGAQPNISKEKIVNALFPLPPLAEQKRIVAKIEELLPYIDRYEQAWSKLEQFNSRFPEDMKKSLLQYAIQGKLVEQRPEEGTAEELFSQIQEEKQRLIAEKKIKKEKPLPEITDDEKPFDIPDSWKWVRFGQIYSLTNGTASRGSKEGSLKSVLRLADISGGSINTCNIRKITLSEKEFESHKVEQDDLIIIRVNGSKDRVATAYRYIGLETISYCDHLFCGHRYSKQINVAYIMHILNSYPIRVQLIPEIKTTAGQNTINQESMSRILIPLPPLAEQKRIVEKLEQLLPLCERLR
ncbi:MAG: restriction endonuclease subunit S [Hydrogeniiclostridium sp.]|mgnify:CR=1 FL=1